ncbi:uncharacterized protein PO1_contig-030-28 [Mycobacterium sp. PO1]|nr:uncharacterized protein PO1_contig-030-28 [Mycobacterium sp. PO1]GFM26548.1 uncharacterized protein PO2_contig-098-57 [Mycobacterium sp. PO2]
MDLSDPWFMLLVMADRAEPFGQPVTTSTHLLLGAMRGGWRALADRFTDEQVERLTTMERHPAYLGRPEFLLLEALEYVQPGFLGEYLAEIAAQPEP